MGRVSPALKHEREENERLRDQLARQDAWISKLRKSPPEVQGCSDGGCIWGHPGGMHTNGGCHCLESMRLPHRDHEGWRRAMLNVRALRDTIAGLRAMLQEEQRDKAVIWETLGEVACELGMGERGSDHGMGGYMVAEQDALVARVRKLLEDERSADELRGTIDRMCGWATPQDGKGGRNGES